MRAVALPTAHDLGSFANRARMASGLSLLAWDGSLAAAALAHAHDLVRSGRFSHDGSDGSNVMQRVSRQAGAWAVVGENLAMGMPRPDQAIAGWLESPPHRENLLRAEFTHAGAAVLELPRRPFVSPGLMWVQVYGTPISTGPPMFNPRQKGDGPCSLSRLLRRPT